MRIKILKTLGIVFGVVVGFFYFKGLSIFINHLPRLKYVLEDPMREVYYMPFSYGDNTYIAVLFGTVNIVIFICLLAYGITYLEDKEIKIGE